MILASEIPVCWRDHGNFFSYLRLDVLLRQLCLLPFRGFLDYNFFTFPVFPIGLSSRSEELLKELTIILGRLPEKPNDSVTLFDIFCSIFQVGKAAQLESSSCWHGIGHIEMQVEMLTAQIRCC